MLGVIIMISKFEFDLDLTKEMNATVLEDTDLTGDNTTELKLYIPLIMANITKGEPKSTSLVTKGNNIFKSVKKPKITKAILKERNYLETDMNSLDNVGDMSSTVEMLSSSTKKVNYKINKNSTVRAKFLNGKISKLSYSTTSESSTTKSIESTIEDEN